jgi:hypothetical protein
MHRRSPAKKNAETAFSNTLKCADISGKWKTCFKLSATINTHKSSICAAKKNRRKIKEKIKKTKKKLKSYF